MGAAMRKRNRQLEADWVAKQRTQPPAPVVNPEPARVVKPPAAPPQQTKPSLPEKAREAAPRRRLTPEEQLAKRQRKRDRYKDKQLRPHLAAVLAALGSKWPELF